MGVFHNHSKPCPAAESHKRMHKCFLICNYILLSAASSCIFLTLSLRLFPSLPGFFLVLLHLLTILGAVSGCSVASAGTSGRWYAAHMVATSLTAIFQGSVAVLMFTQSAEFLGYLKSYVREENGEVILKMAAGLGLVIFGFEWVALTLAFLLRYYAFVEGNNGGSAHSTAAPEFKSWPLQTV